LLIANSADSASSTPSIYMFENLLYEKFKLAQPKYEYYNYYVIIH